MSADERAGSPEHGPAGKGPGPVDLHVEGRPIDLPPGIDLSAYRIVQEALTNTLKHANAAHASVTGVTKPARTRYPWTPIFGARIPSDVNV